MRNNTISIRSLSEMQVALLSAGLGTVSQVEKINSEMLREARQSKIEAAYKAASKKIAAGDRSKKVLDDYSRLRRLVSSEVRLLF
jgi:hypothetical protein